MQMGFLDNMLFGLPTGLAILVSRLAMHMRAFYEGILATRDFHWYCPWQMPARIACPAIENMLVDRHEASDGLVDVRPLPKPVGYNWSYWNAGRAHLVPHFAAIYGILIQVLSLL
jgi:hypothetical protein